MTPLIVLVMISRNSERRGFPFHVGKTDAERECQHECRHYAHQWRNFYREEGGKVVGSVHGLQIPWRYKAREKGVAYGKAHEPGNGGGGVGEGGGGEKHLSGFMPDVGNCRGDEPDDDKRNEEAEKLAEDGIECSKQSAEPDREELSGNDSEPDGNKNLEEKIYFRKFHGISDMSIFFNQSFVIGGLLYRVEPTVNGRKPGCIARGKSPYLELGETYRVVVCKARVGCLHCCGCFLVDDSKFKSPGGNFHAEIFFGESVFLFYGNGGAYFVRKIGKTCGGRRILLDVDGVRTEVESGVYFYVSSGVGKLHEHEAVEKNTLRSLKTLFHGVVEGK